MAAFLEQAGSNPGRSGHRLSIAAARIVYQAREAVAELFHVLDPLRVIFTPNVTYGLNLALKGLLRPGDRVVTSGIEQQLGHAAAPGPGPGGRAPHGRPVRADGRLDLRALEQAVVPGTRLVVVTHASNVVGTILPVREIATIAHRAGARLLVDAAQTAGVLPIDQPAMGIDLLAFTGHKGLLGPPGTGGLVLGDGLDVADLPPLVRGGTGSRSESDEQPELAAGQV